MRAEETKINKIPKSDEFSRKETTAAFNVIRVAEELGRVHQPNFSNS